MIRLAGLALVPLIAFVCGTASYGETVTFFNPTQVGTLVVEGPTWDTIRSNGYYFTYTRDKHFTGGGSEPIGRYVRIPWPQGVEAQAVTAGPNPGKAKITIERVDGDVFDFSAFTARLLANTYGAGGSFEVVPFLDGEEVLPDPVTFNATGFAGSTFSYDTSPNPWGSTAPLTGYDKYSIGLYVDFALIGLAFEGATIPGPDGDFNNDLVVDAADYVVWHKMDGMPYGYNEWRANFGLAAGSGAAANASIPEPATILLMAVALLAGVAVAADDLARQLSQTRTAV